MISVIVAVKDGAATLDRCIESVTGQSYSAADLVIIDGGSKDGSVEIIKKHAAKLGSWMSEPDTGSDLASIRTRAERSADGWVINGRKVWTSGAHRAHYMIALVRTGERGATRHGGMSQFLVDMQTTGLSVRPILNPLGEHDFNEVTFDDVWVPHENLIGAEGEGWKQVGAELAFERSGPERYLSCSQLLLEMLDAADADDPRHAEALGRVVAQYGTLRQMSLGRCHHAGTW